MRMIVVLLLAISSFAQTKSINIGTFSYRGTGLPFDGGTTVTSSYDVHLQTTGITAAPITFGNLIVFVKGSKLPTTIGFPSITTDYGCNPNPTDSLPAGTNCDLSFSGGPSSLGYRLPTCATYNATKNVFTQNYISIGLQIVSTTGKNFSILLANGETFCTSAITNVYVTTEHQPALEPQCDVNGFCKEVTVPIILRALPIQNCQ